MRTPKFEFNNALRSPLRSLMGFSLATNLLLLSVPIHMLQVYDRILTSRSVETLIYLTLIVFAALAAYAIAEVIRARIAQRVSNSYMLHYAEDTFDFLVHDRKNTVDANTTLRDINTVRGFLASRQFINLFDLPFVPLFLLLMFFLHITLGLVMLVGIAAMVIVAFFNNKTTAPFSQDSARKKSEASTFSIAVMRRTEDVRAMGLLPAILSRWGDKTAASINSADTATQYSSAFYGASRFVRQFLQVFTMAWGAFLVIGGDMSGGMIIAATMLLGKALTPIEQLIGSWGQIADAWLSHNNVSKAKRLTEERAETIELPQPEGKISVENLVFHPGAEEGRAPVLNDISFTLDPGNVLALLGPSGAGKSTLAKMIVGALEPTSGTIRLDGFDIDHWPDDQRGDAIGYVPQDIILFPGTIAENIARLEITPSDIKIVQAAKMAGVHEMIAKLPDGYSTYISPTSNALSAGQRQRIALARAFYSEPKVLILDEPNAHLDQISEKILLEVLANARAKGVAVLIVSQRRSVLKIADHAMVIEEGKITSIKVIRNKVQSSPKSGNPDVFTQVQAPPMAPNLAQEKHDEIKREQREEAKQEADDLVRSTV